MDLIDRKRLDETFTTLRFDEKGNLAHWGDRKDWCLHGHEIEKLIADQPTVDAVPLDKLCEWLGALCDTPCMIAEGICERNCQGYKPSDAECWKAAITKWMEGLDAAD